MKRKSKSRRKGRLGTGVRFRTLVNEIQKRARKSGKRVCAPCVAASVGRRRWGKKRFQKLAAAGRRRGRNSIVEAIRPGDRVTIKTHHGSILTGRAVMRSSHGGWVLNLGGRHGTPGLADERNIVKVSPSKRRHGWNPRKRLYGSTLSKKNYDLVGDILAYESGVADAKTTKRLFKHLKKSGIGSKLQGHYSSKM